MREVIQSDITPDTSDNMELSRQLLLSLWERLPTEIRSMPISGKNITPFTPLTAEHWLCQTVALCRALHPEKEVLPLFSGERLRRLHVEPARDKYGGTPRITCFGTFSLLTAEGENAPAWRTNKVRELCAFLVHNRERRLFKEKILHELWPDLDEEKASMLLHTTLYQVRKLFKECGMDKVISFNAGAYCLNLGGIICDVDKFDYLLVQAENVSGEIAVMALEEAVRLSQGSYLEEVDALWSQVERERLRRKKRTAVRRLIALYISGGRDREAAGQLREFLAENPLLEEGHALLMQVYARMGDRQAVLGQYETLCTVLDEELGLSPDSALQHLYYRLCSEQQDNIQIDDKMLCEFSKGE